MGQKIRFNLKLYNISILKIKEIITKYHHNILKDFIKNPNQINLIKLMNLHSKFELKQNHL